MRQRPPLGVLIAAALLLTLALALTFSEPSSLGRVFLP
jgi:hypothetical protein